MRTKKKKQHKYSPSDKHFQVTFKWTKKIIHRHLLNPVPSTTYEAKRTRKKQAAKTTFDTSNFSNSGARRTCVVGSHQFLTRSKIHIKMAERVWVVHPKGTVKNGQQRGGLGRGDWTNEWFSHFPRKHIVYKGSFPLAFQHLKSSQAKTSFYKVSKPSAFTLWPPCLKKFWIFLTVMKWKTMEW